MTDRRDVSIVSGDMDKDYGTVESWLTDRKLYVSSSPVDNGEGKFAVTHYKTIKRANGYSLMVRNACGKAKQANLCDPRVLYLGGGRLAVTEPLPGNCLDL